MIVLNTVFKTHRAGNVETVALNGVTLSIHKGEYVSIVGPSGCGKSTLLSILGMLDRPDSGSYSFDGVEVKAKNEAQLSCIRRSRVGFIFQNFNLIEELSVKENISLALEYSGVARPFLEKRVNESMERLGISHRANHRPSQLSGGQQQRVAIARAWVNNPAVLLADEPTGNLDSAHGADVMELLKQMNKEGTTLVMVTHAPEFAAQTKRVIQMRDGQIVSDSASVNAIAQTKSERHELLSRGA
jgi:putative ABC transport system ATP-binding protein